MSLIRSLIDSTLMRGFWDFRRGEGNPAATITLETVRSIRLANTATPRPLRRELAKRFGVSEGIIKRVVTGRNWKEQP